MQHYIANALLKQFRDNIGRYLLSRERPAKREARVMNFHNSNEIAVLYESDSEASLIMIKQYIKNIKAEFGIKRVMALAFVNSRDVPRYHQHQLEYDYLHKKDINWYRKPTSMVAKNFIVKDYDILIDFTEGNCIPLNFILVQSKAKFKVGKSTSEMEEHYDMSINVKDGGTFERYIKQTTHFLNKINHRA